MPVSRASRLALACFAALVVATPAFAADYPSYPTYPTPAEPIPPTYPTYPTYPEYPTEPGTCPTGQVGTPPSCQPVAAPPIDPLPDPPKTEDPKSPVVITPAPIDTPAGPAKVDDAKPAKVTVAFKSKTKVSANGTFSVACQVEGAPEGARCRLRVLAGTRVIGSKIVAVPKSATAARLNFTLTKANLKRVPKTRKVRVALDLIDANGKILAVAPSRQMLTLPKAKKKKTK